ncbi:MAG: 30S ribosomal protein S4e [Candidatus Heimdallarchaeaceae archaeon]
MTKAGGSKHLKRFVVSKHIPIHKKEYKFTVRPSPGPHAANDCIPIAILLRDLFGFARNMSEVKRILHERNVVVDGKVRRDRKYPAGFMDTISFPKINKHYRMIYLPQKGLRPIPIDEEESKVKLCQIRNKTTLKGGKIQLNLHDGRNIVLDEEEVNASRYSTFDTIKITLPDQKILEKYELALGHYGLITSGRWMGMHGIIEHISEHGTLKTKTATLRLPSGEKIETLYRYIFVVGKEEPSITIISQEGEY